MTTKVLTKTTGRRSEAGNGRRIKSTNGRVAETTATCVPGALVSRYSAIFG